MNLKRGLLCGALALFSIALCAQGVLSTEVSKDTAYFEEATVNGIKTFSEVRKKELGDGGETITKVVVGDSSALAAHVRKQAELETQQIALAVGQARRNVAALAAIRDRYDKVLAETGLDPAAPAQRSLESALLRGSWTVNNGSDVAIEFRRSGAGILQWRTGGAGGTWKGTEVYGSTAFALLDYPATNGMTYLFKVSDRRWANDAGTITLKG